MTSDAPRLLRRSVTLLLPGVLAVVLSACGAPRVYEVYRLGALESSVDSLLDERGSALSDAQRDLRRMAIAARDLHPQRSRAALVEAAKPPMLVALGSSTLHECMPHPLAEFTGGSAMTMAPEQNWLAFVYAPSPLGTLR
jgi:hypothetical protein